MRAYIVAAALLLAAFPAFAGTATLTWTAPTTRTDGSALTGAVTYKVYRGTSAAALTFLSNSTASTFTDATAPAGTVFYAVSAVDAAGLESAKTAAVSVVVPVAPPSPPSGLTVVAVVAGVNVALVFPINAAGSRGATVLGFVPVGTTVSGPRVFAYRGRDYCQVDPALVQWWATAPTTAAAVACG